MSGFTKGIANPMATEPTLLAPLSTVSGSTTSNSTTLVLDMQTYERVAIPNGLIGSDMFLHIFYDFDFYFFLRKTSSSLDFLFTGLLVAFIVCILSIRRIIQMYNANLEV